MNTFAFIVHPITIEQLKNFWPLIRIVPDFIIKTSLKNLPPFKVSHIKSVRSIQGKEIQGYFIACPLLHKQMLDLEKGFVLEKIISAGHIAERLGADIVGLGGYTSIVGDKGQTIANSLKIPVTSGNTYTAWSVFEAIYRMAKVKNIDLKKSHLAVIGATGSIGSLCVRKFSEYIPKITITAKHRDKLERLKDTILNFNGVEVNIEEDAHTAVKNADIVITTTSAPEALLNIEELKSGALVCDVSVPKNIAGKVNPQRDISLIDGVLIKLPFETDFGVDTGLPKVGGEGKFN